MKKIAIIGANEFQTPLILKAKELGYETHVFAWEDGAVGAQSADFFYPISIVEKQLILDECQRIGISAVVSIGSDLAVHTVNYIARALGFPCNSEQTDMRATNKYLMRQTFDAAGLYTPRFCVVEKGFIPEMDLRYPVIVKPTDRSGSRGIYRIDTPNRLNEAIQSACNQSFEKKAIVEEFISGEEYSAEGISWDGNYRILAFTKKYTTGSPHFIETGHVQPSDLNSEQIAKATSVIEKAIKALDIQWGASHAEFRIMPDGEIAIIEIGARMGGDCIGSDLVEISTGYDYLRMVIDTAEGREPSFERTKAGEKAEIRFIMNQNDYEHYKKLILERPDCIYRVSDIDVCDGHTVTDSSNRLGFYIMHGNKGM